VPDAVFVAPSLIVLFFGRRVAVAAEDRFALTVAADSEGGRFPWVRLLATKLRAVLDEEDSRGSEGFATALPARLENGRESTGGSPLVGRGGHAQDVPYAIQASAPCEADGEGRG
jgi:hypothetical protein